MKWIKVNGKFIEPENINDIREAKKKDNDIPKPVYKRRLNLYEEFCKLWAKECLRVLKPGGYLLSFSSTRTYHRMVVGLEDVGFDIQNLIAWLTGQGFPKGTDVSKNIDKKKIREYLTEELGHKPTDIQFKQAYQYEREVIDKVEPLGRKNRNTPKKGFGGTNLYSGGEDEDNLRKVEEPATEEAKKWDGWKCGKSSLKPAIEPVVVAQKNISEDTYIENILRWNVGTMNIDATRINTDEIKKMDSIQTPSKEKEEHTYGEYKGGNKRWSGDGTNHPKGRFPANVILDEISAEMLDEQTGELDGVWGKPSRGEDNGLFGVAEGNEEGIFHKNTGGGASRFFYTAKAHKSERGKMGKSGTIYESIEDGEIIEEKEYEVLSKDEKEEFEQVKNDVATLKSLDLMRYLTRLVIPKDGIVLDPFIGSGTTAVASIIEGFNYIGIEKRDRFANLIAPKRIEYWSDPKHWEELKEHEELPDKDIKKENTGSFMDFAEGDADDE